jgi:hypothetical protein
MLQVLGGSSVLRPNATGGYECYSGLRMLQRARWVIGLTTECYRATNATGGYECYGGSVGHRSYDRMLQGATNATAGSVGHRSYDRMLQGYECYRGLRMLRGLGGSSVLRPNATGLRMLQGATNATGARWVIGLTTECYRATNATGLRMLRMRLVSARSLAAAACDGRLHPPPILSRLLDGDGPRILGPPVSGSARINREFITCPHLNHSQSAPPYVCQSKIRS